MPNQQSAVTRYG
jgi:WD40 repeat protein